MSKSDKADKESFWYLIDTQGIRATEIDMLRRIGLIHWAKSKILIGKKATIAIEPSKTADNPEQMFALLECCEANDLGYVILRIPHVTQVTLTKVLTYLQPAKDERTFRQRLTGKAKRLSPFDWIQLEQGRLFEDNKANIVLRINRRKIMEDTGVARVQLRELTQILTEPQAQPQ